MLRHKMPLFRLQAACIISSFAAFYAHAADVCALVPEGTAAALSCPAGHVISGFSFATFGTFAAGSDCTAGLTPAPACPVTVLAQASRLCTGARSCNVSCDCDSLPSPCGCSSSTPSLDGAVLRLALPGVPCNGVAKQLGLIASCEPALPPPAPQPAPVTTAPTNPLLEFMPSPVVGLDNLLPHFSWTPPASTTRQAPSAIQSAARIVVVSYENGATVWDSGIVNTTTPLMVPASPLPLTSDSRYMWTVTTADGSGAWSRASVPARFNTGLLLQSDWSGAAWIGGWRAGTLLRKDFTVAAGAPAAYVSVFVSACQYYLLYIDGVRVGARELDVVWTRFMYFRSYSSYELDPSLLPPGPHTIGLALGQGFCGQSQGKAGTHTPQALLRLALHTSDGSLLQSPVVTNATWSSGSGPVLTDSNYYGEQYNASMYQPGWAAPGFVPPAGAPPWTPAVYTNDPAIPPTMSSQLMPPIMRVAAIRPLSVTPVDSPGLQRWTYDFGQHVSGRAKITLPPGTPRGTNATMKHTEVMSHPPFATYDGSAWMGNLFWAYPVDSYIASGAATSESYEPSFTEHGFRYVELSIDPPLAAPPGLDTLTAIVLRTNARPQATLRLGHMTLQSISNASWWTEADALMGIPAGAAARGERTGWTGDASAAAESEHFDFDTAAFFTQFLTQMQQLQCSDGTIPSCIPNTDPERDGVPPPLPCSGAEGDPSWGTVYPTIAFNTWKYYGAIGVAAKHYPSLIVYMNMLEKAINNTGLAQIFCTWGDWNPKVKTDCHITAAASYLHDLTHMIELAAALGKASDAAAFSARLSARRREFHTAFWSPALGLYGAGTQAAQAVALWTGAAASAGVAANISSWLGQSMVTGGLTFGFLGVRYAYEALALNGNIEAALRALLQTTYPSYGYELYNLYEPSSALWESWDGDTHRQWLDESSRNHHYQASINTFLRKHVAGLDMPQVAAAWSTISVRPYAALPLPADLSLALPHARVTVDSHRGVIEVSWARIATGLQLNATLPSGSSGSVSVPKTFGAATKCAEGGTSVWAGGAYVPGVPGILAGVDDGDFISFAVTSGAFLFVTSN